MAAAAGAWLRSGAKVMRGPRAEGRPPGGGEGEG